ncbi:MAG: Chromosome (plasmid) partitioning protein ParB [Solirubrobacterales bacterium]|nr:Chromosome (plasmid) partitioning protein ParB [Solirubrobacterales bacterium]
MASTTETPGHTQPELASIPISDIAIEDGFNPRGEVLENDELRALAETIRNHGCLLPIRVRREGNRFVLVAGKRRYRAAQIAGLSEIPASILAAHAGEEPAERLTEALIENELRSQIDPVHRALAYQTLLEQGLTIRGIAERLGGTTGRRGREQRIKEHLEILDLPEQLQVRVGEGEIPMLAVKALRQLAEIHPDLASAAVKAVEPAEEYEEPYCWADVAAAPIQTAVNCCEQLPAGIYSTRESYPLESFNLSEQASADLAVLAEHGHAPELMGFTGPLVDRAAALGAVHDAGWCQIIAGQDVADALAADWLAEARKKSDEHAATAPSRNGVEHGTDAAEAAEQLRQQAAAERAHQCEQHDDAVAYNLRLGVLAFKHLARVKVDERVLRILTAVDVGRSLRVLAARGARLTAPGWVTQTEQKNGRTTTSYLEAHDAQQRAFEFLAGAKSVGEIAGRALTLIALAVHADEEAVAASNRSYYGVSFRGPFAEQAKNDLMELIAERIAEGELPALDERLGRGPNGQDA